MAKMQSLSIPIGDVISSGSSDYKVRRCLGSGSFAVVTECLKIDTNQMVALKMFRYQKCNEDAKEEETIHRKMNEYNLKRWNVIAFNDSFIFNGHYCLEFEKLDLSLHAFMKSLFDPLELEEIRPIMQQLATAAHFLEKVGIVHADLKPENIMLVDRFQKPLRVKVIDFGLALVDPENCRGSALQSMWYRAPEVLLGARINRAIDIWSLGCIAAEMLLGEPLFPGSNNHDMMRHIVSVVNMPPAHLLRDGMWTLAFFNGTPYLKPRQWILKSKFETRLFADRDSALTINKLSDLQMASYRIAVENSGAEMFDRKTFVHLATQMLKTDPAERITPSGILQHPFVTMSHFEEKFSNSPYLQSCAEQMNFCQGQSSDNADELSVVDYLFSLSTTVSQDVRQRKKTRWETDHNPNPDTRWRRRSERLAARSAGTRGRTRPAASRELQRRRDEADRSKTSDDNSTKAKINLKKAMARSGKVIFGDSKSTRSRWTQVAQLRRRSRRHNDESSGSVEQSRSRRLDGNA